MGAPSFTYEITCLWQVISREALAPPIAKQMAGLAYPFINKYSLFQKTKTHSRPTWHERLRECDKYLTQYVSKVTVKIPKQAHYISTNQGEEERNVNTT